MNSSKLVDPLLQQLASSGAVTETSKKAETAANLNEKIDVCPKCGQKMQPTVAAGIPSYVCMEHRVVFPQPDSEN